MAETLNVLEDVLNRIPFDEAIHNQKPVSMEDIDNVFDSIYSDHAGMSSIPAVQFNDHAKIEARLDALERKLDPKAIRTYTIAEMLEITSTPYAQKRPDFKT